MSDCNVRQSKVGASITSPLTAHPCIHPVTPAVDQMCNSTKANRVISLRCRLSTKRSIDGVDKGGAHLLNHFGGVLNHLGGVGSKMYKNCFVRC
jgi:hypothetical protein